MSIKNYYKGEYKAKVFIEIAACNFDIAKEKFMEVKKLCREFTNDYVEILIKINE